MKKSKIILLPVLLLMLTVFSTSYSFGQIVVSEIYGGGGNGGSTYTHDFIELANYGTVAVNLAGWSVQYASNTGTSWSVTNLSGTIQPGGFFLIQESAGGGGTTPLPMPDVTGTITMAANAGKVALVNTTTALAGSCPVGGSIVDFVGYGTSANCFEGTAATSAPSNTQSVQRLFDTNQNQTDFVVLAPNPQNASVITSANANVGGRVLDKNGNGILNVRVKISGGELSEPLFATTNPFGYFNFEVLSGQIYVVTVSSKSHTFSNPTRVISVNDNVRDLNFVADER